MQDKRILAGLREIVGKSNVKLIDKRESIQNTLGITRKIKGIISPASTEEVRRIVLLANKYKFFLYPISRGENIGYGDNLPVEDNCFIVSLERMNAIKEFDNANGFVTVEPGVTQKQLYEFLKRNKSKFWMDVTGASTTASIVGNALEGGFGHTPKGNKRKTISNIEIVLGNGQVLRSGEFPGLGPDISGLFVQSNFGIVTSMRVELFPIPERFESFVIQVKDKSNFGILIEKIKELKHKGILTSLVHVGNALRTFMTTHHFPNNLDKNHVLTSPEAIELMSSWILKLGYWNALGGIYGTGRELKAKKKEIVKSMRGIGKVTFFSDFKINLYSTSVGLVFGNSDNGKKLKRILWSLKSLHGLLKGVPSDEPLKNIYWKIDDKKDLGLIWYAPVIKASPSNAVELVNIAGALYRKYGFEMPITMIFIEDSTIISVFSINFNKKNKDESIRAHKLYNELIEGCKSKGIMPYRNSILSMNKNLYDAGRLELLKKLKRSMDPNGIISPGRYGQG